MSRDHTPELCLPGDLATMLREFSTDLVPLAVKLGVLRPRDFPAERREEEPHRVLANCGLVGSVMRREKAERWIKREVDGNHREIAVREVAREKVMYIALALTAIEDRVGEDLHTRAVVCERLMQQTYGYLMAIRDVGATRSEIATRGRSAVSAAKQRKLLELARPLLKAGVSKNRVAEQIAPEVGLVVEVVRRKLGGLK